MKISICGTHGTGKTTLINSLLNDNQFSNYFFDINVTRWVHSLGFSINENTTGDSQEINMIKRVANLNSFKDYIADRSIIDVLAYSLYGFLYHNIREEDYLYQKTLVKNNIQKYDLIFHLKPEFAIEDDGVRATDIQYQKDIDFLIDGIINEFKVPVINLSGSVEERRTTMLQHIGLQNLAWSV